MVRSKWSFTAEEDEKLIEAISVHPALFDLKHEFYKDQRVKDNIWIIIAGEVGRSGIYTTAFVKCYIYRVSSK